MRLGIGNNLIRGGGSLNPDKLALDLQFAADKTLTARKGPTPAFTRGSNATVVGSNGLVRYAPNNSSLYSGQLVVGTGWSANATPSVTSIVDGLGPDGNNAYEVAEIANTGSHTLFNTGGTGTTGATSVVNGTTYTGSIFVKKVAGSVDWIQLSFSTVGFGSVQYANFNLSNGTIGNFSSSSPQIQDAGNGWYRCSISAVATTTTTTTSNLFLAFTNNADTVTRLLSYAGNTANKVLAAMCQFEIGSTVNTYNPTTTAAFQGPRFDHDPVTLACKGLLIEESRTNLLTNSNFVGWGNTGTITATPNSVDVGIAPDGSYPTKIECTVAGNVQLGFSAISGVTYTNSVYVRSLSGGVNVRIGGIIPGVTTVFNTTNQFVRYSHVNTAVVTGTRFFLFTMAAGEIIYVWGAQVEAGSFPTSYIPTTTSSVIRSVDVCSILSATSLIDNLQGTIEVNFSTNTGIYPVFSSPLTIRDSTGANGVSIEIVQASATTFNQRFRIYVGGIQTQTNMTGTFPILTTCKIAVGYEPSNSIGAKNSVLTATNTSTLAFTLPVTQVLIGSPIATTSPLNGCISLIKIYRKRLTNAKLQTITV